MTRIFAGFAAIITAGALGALGLVACSSETGHLPIARISVDPAYVPLGDGYATDVVLDGSGSSDPVDDPNGAQPLLYQWVVDDDHATILPDARAARVTVRIAGDHPVRVTLTIADGSDDKTSASAIIGVTVP
jgi:hypothetical protein